MIKLVIIATGRDIHSDNISHFRRGKNKKELVMDYAIYDAFLVGFEEVIIVTNKENRNDYQKHYKNENRIKWLNEEMIGNRSKSLGSAYSIYSASNYIDGPFAVISNRNFYGRDSFEKAYRLLKEHKEGMIGYHMTDTYSNYGPVSRGICDIKMNTLFSIAEVENIESDMFKDSIVSMGFWCFSQNFIQYLKKSYFLLDEIDRESKDFNWTIVSMMKDYLKTEKMHVKMSYGNSCSMTYTADYKVFKKKIRMLKEKGIYPNVLFNKHCE